MLFAVAKGRTNNFFRSFIYNYLAFKGVPFLLSRIKMFLSIITIPYPFLIFDFFLGRSIGLSDASIRITSYSISLLRSCFFPGSENHPLLINTSSIHIQVR